MVRPSLFLCVNWWHVNYFELENDNRLYFIEVGYEYGQGRSSIRVNGQCLLGLVGRFNCTILCVETLNPPLPTPLMELSIDIENREFTPLLKLLHVRLGKLNYYWCATKKIPSPPCGPRIERFV